MDTSGPSTASSTPGTLHYIPPNLSAFEPSKSPAPTSNTNTILWIGGMFDTTRQVQYPFTISNSLPSSWTLCTATLGSSGHSWGTSGIAKDAEDMAKIIKYIKTLRPAGKVVIMGHSTGCQDCLEYVVGAGAEKRPPVDGICLQAPVSDREAIEHSLPAAFKQEADQLALKMIRDGHEKDSMPNRLTKPTFGRIAITARRWTDVSSPGPNHAGADDYFSSDLSDERLKKTFGKLTSKTPLLILYSGDEENLPSTLDKEGLVKRWTGIVKAAGGIVDDGTGLVKGASHNLNGCPQDVVQDLVERVVGFVGRVESGTWSTSRI